MAFDLANGQIRWKYTTGNLIGESSPAVGTAAVYIGDLAGVFHAVSIADGKPLWTFKTTSEIKSSPVIVGDLVLIGSYDTNLYALDARTGQLRWKLRTNGMVHATPAVYEGLAFIAGCDSILRAIRIRDGKEAYQIDAGAYTGASPLIDAGRAYFGTFNNEVLAFDLNRRRRLWRYAIPDRQFPFYSSAALANGRVILGGRDKTCTPSTSPRESRPGPLPPALAWIRRRWWPAAASTSGRATAVSTSSTHRPARSCSNSMPAPASPRLPLSPADASSSARRTAVSTCWADGLKTSA